MLMVCIPDMDDSFSENDYTQNKVMMTNRWQTFPLGEFLRQRIQTVMNAETWITPVLVFTNAFVERMAPSDWNDREPKYDIRDWSADGEKMGKGVTLSKEEWLALKELLNHIEL
jgi:hypothetical protein